MAQQEVVELQDKNCVFLLSGPTSGLSSMTRRYLGGEQVVSLQHAGNEVREATEALSSESNSSLHIDGVSIMLLPLLHWGFCCFPLISIIGTKD